MFSKELLHGCKMTAEEFSAPVETLDKDKTYVIGFFNRGGRSVVISYKNGSYCFSDETGIECRPYGFISLNRAYAYFEELFYKQGW